MTRSFAAQLLDSEPRTRATMNRSMVFFSLWLLVLTPLVFPIDPLPSAERVTIASVSPGLFEFPLVVASKKGFFKEENLEVVKVQMQPQISVMALVAGDVDYSLSWGSSLRAVISGLPLKVVAGIAHRPLHVLMARTNIKSGKDLKGRKIGVDSFAGTMEYLSRVAVRHFGLDPDRDVNIVISGSSPTRLAALQAEAIDATPVDIAYAVKGEEAGLRRLINFADILDLPISGVSVTEKKLSTDRDQVKRVIRAILKGTRFMKDNREATIDFMSDALNISASQAARSYDVSMSSFSDDGYIPEKGLMLNIQLTKERLKIAREVPLNQVVDWSLLSEIKPQRRK
jgi:ABC-type nitrate/sulfonate/bicarbonate transport system substrate-binding protein